MNMTEETGYSGDEERGNTSSQSSVSASASSDDGNSQHRNTRKQFFTDIPRRRDCQHRHQSIQPQLQFFTDMPPRRRKRRLQQQQQQQQQQLLLQHQLRQQQLLLQHSQLITPPTTSAFEPQQCSKTTALYYSSRWVNQYFLNQNVVAASGSTTPDKIPEEIFFDDKKHVLPLISSCRHVLVEEAISFSPHPRVLIESDIPHRVVHTNAAYMRKYGSSSGTKSIFTAPHVASRRDLELAVGSLFDSAQSDAHGKREDSLIMYPVWGCDKEADGAPALVTHYLIEANNCEPPETITTPSALYKENTDNRWRKRPAHAIA